MEEFISKLQNIESRVEELEKETTIETLIFGADGIIVIPVYTIDPIDFENGQMWINSTDNTFKVVVNNAIKTVTIT